MEKKQKRKEKFLSIADEWNRIAAKWTQVVRNKEDIFREVFTLPVTLKILGGVKSKRVLDLGCGEGYYTRILAKKGAKEIVGVDISSNMIKFAQEEENRKSLNIKYYCCDAGKMKMLKNSYFDLIVSFMTVMDMETLNPVAREVRRVLKRKGKFIFSIIHPCFSTAYGHAWRRRKDGYEYCAIENYFNRESATAEFTLGAGKYSLGRMTFLRSTLADYVNSFTEKGLFVSKIYEPTPSKRQVTQFPGLAKYQRIPFFIIFEMVKR